MHDSADFGAVAGPTRRTYSARFLRPNCGPSHSILTFPRRRNSTYSSLPASSDVPINGIESASSTGIAWLRRCHTTVAAYMSKMVSLPSAKIARPRRRHESLRAEINAGGKASHPSKPVSISAFTRRNRPVGPRTISRIVASRCALTAPVIIDRPVSHARQNAARNEIRPCEAKLERLEGGQAGGRTRRFRSKSIS